MSHGSHGMSPLRRSSVAWDLGLVAISWIAAYFLWFGAAGAAKPLPSLRDSLVQLPLVLGVWRLTFGAIGLYRPRRGRSPLEECAKIGWASLVASLVLVLVLRVVFREFNYSRGVILVFLGLSFTTLSTSRALGAARSAWRAVFVGPEGQVASRPPAREYPLFRDALVVAACWLVVLMVAAVDGSRSVWAATLYFWLLSLAFVGVSHATWGHRPFDFNATIVDGLKRWVRRASTVERTWVSPPFMLVSDVLLLAGCWLGAYLIWFYVARSPGTGATIPPLRPYVAQLPAILSVSLIMLRVFGLYDKGEARPCPLRWMDVAKATTGAAAVVFMILRVALAHYNYSRAVILLFWLLSFVAVGLSRTVLSSALNMVEGWVVARFLPIRTLLRISPSVLSRQVSENLFRKVTLLMSGRYAGLRWVPIILVFNLLWYGSYLSFPLIGEDGAALYSSLVETVRSGQRWQPNFPIKWLEGLGQPNVFVTVTFDPFSWFLLSGFGEANSFRLSYALRATVCWLATYLFVKALFRGVRSIAVTSAFLSMLVSFILTHPWGIPTFAGIFVATHAALFPGLLWLYLGVVRDRKGIGWRDVRFSLGLVLFLLMYPVGSLMGLSVLIAFGLVLVVTLHGVERRAATRSLIKLMVVSGVALFTPVVGLYDAWSAVATVSARSVFSGELTTYPKGYLLPLLWHDVPLGLRVIVLLGLSLLLIAHRWPRPIRTVALLLGIVIGASQITAIIRTLEIFPDLLERLPRPFYLEYYLPAFYAVAAAYVVHRWRLFRQPLGTRRLWPVRVAAFGAGVWLMLGASAALLVVVVCLGLLEFGKPGFSRANPQAAWVLPGVTVLTLFLGAAATWVIWPQGIHPVFAAEFSCRQRPMLWCQDRPGRSMGAGSTPITEFLRTKLSSDGTFQGRAEFLLRPAQRLVEFPIGASANLTPEEFESVRSWYARAYRRHRAWFPERYFRLDETHFRHAPSYFRYEDRQRLIQTMDALARNGEPTLGVLPDDVIIDIATWAGRQFHRIRGLRYLPVWEHLPEVTIMVEERNRNFLETGNGMLLRALPLQGVPVASSYEQALDYLYYLLWTRYVNEGVPARRSINFTSLEILHPDRLALLGVRYIVARDVPFASIPDLPRAFAWEGYTIYQINEPNLAGFAPTRVVFAGSLAEELRAMLAPSFDSASEAVVAESERESLDGLRQLARMNSSELSFSGQSALFRATSPGRTLAVLPVRFSHCWRAEWMGPPGRIVRVDIALVGVVFERSTRLRLSWSAGYGPAGGCLRQDMGLVRQAIKAAAQVP